MSYDLGSFALGDMLRCGLELRRNAKDAATMEDAAQAIVRHLYDECRDGDGQRSCVLARFYKTHPYATLEPELQRFARAALGGADPRPGLRCLTLLASAGAQPAWNRRQASHGHRAVPLASTYAVERAPMIAQLIRSLGLEIGDVVNASHDVVRALAGKTHGVFHVEEAVGSPYIPAQEDFVKLWGVRSVLGFGGMLPTGELFAVILFSRRHVPEDSADRFRNVALDVKTLLLNFGPDEVFSAGDAAPEALAV